MLMCTVTFLYDVTIKRYWTMIASPVADMEGGREQSVWFRFQQLQCAGEKCATTPPIHFMFW